MGWERKRFVAASTRRFTTFSGESIPSPLVDTGGISTAGFFQWCDTSMAVAWFAEARRLAIDTRKIASINALPLSPDRNKRQLEYAHSIVAAIANGFNCLNVPWYMHQLSRIMYNDWLSGPMIGAMIPDPHQNSTSDWYAAPGEPYLPIISDRSRGILPRMARTLYKSRVPSGVAHNLFVQTIGIGVSIAGFENRNDKDALRGMEYTSTQWYYEHDIVNQPFVMAHNGGMLSDVTSLCDDATAPLALPYRCDMDLPGDGWIVETDHTPLTNSNRLPTIAGTVPTVFTDDWRSFRTDLGVTLGGDPRMKVSLGQYHYLGWLRAWTEMLVQQSPAEIIMSCREMALWFNLGTLRRNASAAEALVNAPSTQQAQAAHPDAAMLAGAAAATAIGAALASVTYGISALIGAGVATGLTIAAVMPDPARIATGRDDLGRWKPILERSWCGGDPSSPSVDARPLFDVPAPHGYVSTGLVVGSRYAGVFGRTAADAMDSLRRGPSKPASTGKTVAGLATVGGSAFLAYKLLASLKR